jgi:hypothetical protein
LPNKTQSFSYNFKQAAVENRISVFSGSFSKATACLHLNRASLIHFFKLFTIITSFFYSAGCFNKILSGFCPFSGIKERLKRFGRGL